MRAANGFDPARSGRVPVFRKPVPPSPGFGQRAVPHSISHLYHYTIEAQPHATQRAFERYNKKTASAIALAVFQYGAAYEARTRYLHLGKVALYQMS